MEQFNDAYGILKLVAAAEIEKEEDKDNNQNIFFGKLEKVLQVINSKGGFNDNGINSF